MFFIVFMVLNLIFIPSKAFSQDFFSYTCQTNDECLKTLKESFLDKQKNTSIYKHCDITFSNNKICCENSTSCTEDWSTDLAIQIRDQSSLLSSAEQSCQTNQLSNIKPFLDTIQKNMCSQAVLSCQEECQKSLDHFKAYFKSCFKIPDHLNLDNILEKSKSPTENHSCYHSMNEIMTTYKLQSLNQQELRSNLKTTDLVHCEKIEEARTPTTLNNLTLAICQIAQQRQQQRLQAEEQNQKAKEKEEQIRKAKEKEEQNQKAKEEEQKRLKEEQARLRKEEGERIKAVVKQMREEKIRRILAQENKTQTSSISTTPVISNSLKQSQPETNTLNTKTTESKKSNKEKTEVAKTTPNKIKVPQTQNSSQSASNLKNSSYGNQTRNKMNVSPENIIQVAQVNSSTRCPFRLPNIKSTIIFQSVEAPQIEPIEEQDSPYDNYDLVMGKPASLLVQLDRQGMDKKQEFAMDVLISKHSKYLEKCFHTPMKGTFKEDEEDWCFFTKKNLRSDAHRKKGKDHYYKFFQLPMNESFLNKGNKSDHLVSVAVYPRGYHKNSACIKKKKFNINIIKTQDLNISFTKINKKNCYDTLSFQTIKEFASSYEMSNIKTMFPLKKLYITYFHKSSIKGRCDNRYYIDRNEPTVGVLADVAELESLRASNGQHKLIAVVPQSYLDFHNIPGVAGIVILPVWKYLEQHWWFFKPYWVKSGFLGGSWNIAFVGADQLNKGTIAHELAHTLGQEKEFYEPKNKDCKQFKGDSFEDCKDYKIPRALKTFVKNKGQHWKFLENKVSIMHESNEDKIRDRWIDRDTYQKTFQVLSKQAVIPKTYELYGNSIQYQQANKKASKKAILVGFYDEKKRKFILSRSKIQNTRLFTPSLSPKIENTKLPVITFQLKEGEKILQTIKQPVLKMQMEIFYKNKAPQTKPLALSPLIVAFKLPSNYQKRNLKIVVLDPWKKQIFSISIKKRNKPINVSTNLIDKNNKRI